MMAAHKEDYMVRRLLLVFALVGALVAPVPSFADAREKKSTATGAEKPETAPPKGATAQCKDGTYSTAQTRQGACSRHGGVATWLAKTTEETKPAEKGAKPATKEEPKATETPAGAPPNATAQCKDGTYSFSAHRSGTCSHHGGVKTWLNRPAK
jgi:uncharacterized protein with FMN-binding domain